VTRSFDFEAGITVGSTLVVDGDPEGVATGTVGTSERAYVSVLFSTTGGPPLVPADDIRH
jgi:hypothetical protein